MLFNVQNIQSIHLDGVMLKKKAKSFSAVWLFLTPVSIIPHFCLKNVGKLNASVICLVSVFMFDGIHVKV